MAGFQNMGALSVGSDPDRASIPFDKERHGFVLGEGAGILVLEEYEHAVSRGAKIYAELVGYGATGDAYHITSPDPEGLGAAKAMEFAMQEAGIVPEQVGYITPTVPVPPSTTSLRPGPSSCAGRTRLPYGGPAPPSR